MATRKSTTTATGRRSAQRSMAAGNNLNTMKKSEPSGLSAGQLRSLTAAFKGIGTTLGYDMPKILGQGGNGGPG